MALEKQLDDHTTLSETDIDFFGDYDVRLHFNSGRNPPEPSDESDGDRISMMPCPTVDIYEMEDALEILIWLPVPDPIIFNHFRVTDEYEAELHKIVRSLENSYNGIIDVDDFRNNNDELAEMVYRAFHENTPDTVSIASPILTQE